MKEVKSPKKPLIYYYSIILLIVLLFNLIVSPLLMKNQVTEVDYGTFMRMIEEKNIGEVGVEDDERVLWLSLGVRGPAQWERYRSGGAGRNQS